jgi:hypothetical protein
VAVTRRAGDLIGDLRDRADIELMEKRHSDKRLRQYLTQSLRALQNELVRAGYTEHLTWGASAALPTTAADSGAESYLEVAFPAGAIEVFGVDVNNGTEWYPLVKINVEDRRQYEGSRSGELPKAYLIQSIPSTTPATTTTAGVIQIYPASTRGLDYRTIYQAAFPELTKNAQLIYGFDGDFFEWVLWDAAIKVLYRDDEADPSQDQKAVRERAIVQDRIKTNIKRVARGPILPRRAGSRRSTRG